MTRLFHRALFSHLSTTACDNFVVPWRGLQLMSFFSDDRTLQTKKTNELIRRYSQQKTMSETCRRWIKVGSKPCLGKNDFRFTMMSYNILAQELLEIHEDLYDRHDPVALSWSHRYDRLMAEINIVRPDILCLQELQYDHKEQFTSGLSNFNYDTIYKKRTGNKPDGCAIYFRRDLFELVEQQDVELYQPMAKRLDRENVAIIAKLRVKSNPSLQLVVATTHLLYNPRRQDVRLAQIQVLLAELDRLAYCGHHQNGTLKYAPTILCGDFNLQPYTAPYVLLTTGFLQYENLIANALETFGNGAPFGKHLLPPALGITDDCQHDSIIGRNQVGADNTRLYNSAFSKSSSENHTQQSPIEAFSQGTLRHRFKFTSAYRHNIGEPNQEASTFQREWITVDYLFYSKFQYTGERSFTESNLSLEATYSLPTVRQARDIYTIPNMYFGSDHFALAGRFLLKAQTEPKL